MKLKYNGVTYPENFGREKFEKYTEVPEKLVQAFFSLKEARDCRKKEYLNHAQALEFLEKEGVEAYQNYGAAIREKYPVNDFKSQIQAYGAEIVFCD